MQSKTSINSNQLQFHLLKYFLINYYHLLYQATDQEIQPLFCFALFSIVLVTTFIYKLESSRYLINLGFNHKISIKKASFYFAKNCTWLYYFWCSCFWSFYFSSRMVFQNLMKIWNLSILSVNINLCGKPESLAGSAILMIILIFLW